MNKIIMYLGFLAFIGALTLSCNEADEIPEIAEIPEIVEVPEIEEPTNPIEVPEGYSLLWSEEFDGSAINKENWTYETGNGTDYGLPAGWGNNELQLYTESTENSGIEMEEELSTLYIRATSDGNGGYNSAKLTTKEMFSMRFGRIDVKARMPEGQGIWPAIWMLGDNIDEASWPGCGEIDIIELLGHEPNKMYSTLHYTNGNNAHSEIPKNYQLPTGTFNDAYHVFSLEWTPDHLMVSIDETELQAIPIVEDMKEFLRSFYLILNVAVGGNWPGVPDNTTSFPQTMQVDYIRVFEKNDFVAPDAPALDLDEESLGQNIEVGIAQNAIKDGFNVLGNTSVLVWGAGGEPMISTSDLAINGPTSLVFEYPGGNWGGGYIELETPSDLSAYTHLKFSLNKPSSLTDAEIKLESPTSNATVFLMNYEGREIGQEFLEYTIPLSDFEGLDLTQVSIPFSMWNPKDANKAFAVGAVYIDNFYFTD